MYILLYFDVSFILESFHPIQEVVTYNYLVLKFPYSSKVFINRVKFVSFNLQSIIVI